MRDPHSDDRTDPVRQPALSWLTDPTARRHSPLLALLALPPAPDPAPGAKPGAAPDEAPAAGAPEADRAAGRPAGEAVAALPRRDPARPAPVVPGPRAPVLDRAWARDQGTLQRIIVGLRAL